MCVFNGASAHCTTYKHMAATRKDDVPLAGYDCSGLTRWAYYKAYGADVNDGATGTQVQRSPHHDCCNHLGAADSRLSALSLMASHRLLLSPAMLAHAAVPAHRAQRPTGCSQRNCPAACAQESRLTNAGKRTTSPVPGGECHDDSSV
jgi:cell wall-associated NlpC family hydrolase